MNFKGGEFDMKKNLPTNPGNFRLKFVSLSDTFYNP